MSGLDCSFPEASSLPFLQTGLTSPLPNKHAGTLPVRFSVSNYSRTLSHLSLFIKMQLPVHLQSYLPHEVSWVSAHLPALLPPMSSGSCSWPVALAFTTYCPGPH